MVQPLSTTHSSALNFEATIVSSSPEINKIAKLFSQITQILPICRESTDALGRKMRLWEIPGNDFFCGTILHPNGQIAFIPASKVINPLQGPCSIQTIRKIKQLENRHWQLAYLDSQHQLVIWPHIAAAAQDRTWWESVSFHLKDSQTGHIFSEEEGHFAKDTPENRAYILAAVTPESELGGSQLALVSGRFH